MAAGKPPPSARFSAVSGLNRPAAGPPARPGWRRAPGGPSRSSSACGRRARRSWPRRCAGRSASFR
ncbi:hypothetical protein [Ideonella benzenivorans]|uniref:hypothetical protein n=1 Tax=Ideonella benzenivorans TaxID=2831643 RepID=UPI0035BFE102